MRMLDWKLIPTLCMLYLASFLGKCSQTESRAHADDRETARTSVTPKSMAW